MHLFFRLIANVLILLTCIGKISSQEVPYFKFYLFPVGAPLGSNTLSEHGLGYYDFNYKSNNIQFGIFYFTKLSKKFTGKFGFNLKKLNHKFDYIITDPLDEIHIFTHESRYMNKIVLSPHIGLNYTTNHFAFSIGIEPNLDLHYETNVVSGRTPIYVFIDPVNEKSGQLRAAEKDFYVNRLSYYLSPTCSAGYEIFPNFSIELDAKIKPYGDWTIYRLNIDGRTSDMPQGEFPLNDTRILNRYIILFLGLSYRLHL